MKYFSLFLIFLPGVLPSGGCDNICWMSNGIATMANDCNLKETCVTWDRTCPENSGPNCRTGPWIFTECIPSQKYAQSVEDHSLKPTRKACRLNDVFVLGNTRICSAPPCPPYWTYYCYKRTACTLTCDTIKIKEGYVCTMELNCEGKTCRPVPKIYRSAGEDSSG